MIVFHYSILSEGINCPGLTHCIMLRNLPTIEMLQTIGRVIRISQEDRIAIQNQKYQAGQFEFYSKPVGKIIIPVSSNGNPVLLKRIKMIVDAVFVNGETITT